MSNFFTQLGLGGIDLGIVSLVLLALLVVIFIMLLVERSARVRLERRVDRLSEGTDGESLEESILKVFDEYQNLHSVVARNQKDIDVLFARIKPMIQKMGIVKYDAFHQMGGELSSAIALLDENNNGLIINTVQNVDGCYSYVKEVRKGKTAIDLGKEEAEALDRALNDPRQ